MIQFRDCPHCSKRIRIDASRCHRCHNSVTEWHTLTDELEASEEHFADGGYSDNDDFDYERFLADESDDHPRRGHRMWSWVAWLLIILLLLGGLATSL